MINRHVLQNDDALYVVEHEEFDSRIISSKSKVVVIMTQDWCPQWRDMNTWIYNIQSEQEIDIYELIYNKIDSFDKFRGIKENKWQNHNIPYLRYYKDGKLIKETNYITKNAFSDLIQNIL